MEVIYHIRNGVRLYAVEIIAEGFGKPTLVFTDKKSDACQIKDDDVLHSLSQFRNLGYTDLQSEPIHTIQEYLDEM